ncbi:MAG: hypothetical protein ACFFCY_13955 [Promethearchaeota archaeon]
MVYKETYTLNVENKPMRNSKFVKDLNLKYEKLVGEQDDRL